MKFCISFVFGALTLVSLFACFSQVGKVLLNALIYPGIKTTTQKNSIVAIFHTAVIYIDSEFCIVTNYSSISFSHKLLLKSLVS